MSSAQENVKPDSPMMLRADITRSELDALKIEAIHAGMTVQQFLAHLIRERLAA